MRTRDVKRAVIGTAIYYGQPLKAVKDFCAKNLDQLRAKRLALFICSLIGDKVEAAMKGAFPAELHASAAALGMFGGKIVTDPGGRDAGILPRQGDCAAQEPDGSAKRTQVNKSRAEYEHRGEADHGRPPRRALAGGMLVQQASRLSYSKPSRSSFFRRSL